MRQPLAVTLGLLLALVLVALLVAPGAGQADRRTKNIAPYKTFKFKYTTRKPATRTGFEYRVALRLPSDDSSPPVVEHLTLRFAKGTKVNLEAVPACRADDATLATQGPKACPARGRIGTGPALVWIGPGMPLSATANVFASGRKRIVLVLDVGAGALAVLRGTVTGTRLELPVPRREVAPGVRAALVGFDLKIGGGTARKPVFRTPATCPKGGWPVVYAPRFDTTKAKLTYWTSCRRPR